MPSENTEIILKGISGSPGICIGKAYLVDREGVDVIEKYSITEDKVKKEINRFKSAVTRAKNELTEIIKGVPEELRQHAAILDALFAGDPAAAGAAAEAHLQTSLRVRLKALAS